MSFHENGRLYPYVIPGYTGHIPSQEEQEGGEYKPSPTSQIPGYVGYIKHLKPENMFGKTYGKITDLANTEQTQIGNVIDDNFRYTSSMKEAYINQLEIGKNQLDLTNYPYSMQLTKKLNDSTGNKFFKDHDKISEDKKANISLTAAEVRLKVFG